MSNQRRRNAQELVIGGMQDDGPYTYQCRPYTIVELYSVINGNLYRGVGMSRKGKNDAWNAVMGYEIAFGRAVDQIIKDARLLVR